jgi:hypothetical protein
VIYDLGSSGGTLVNGDRVSECLLQPGDVINHSESRSSMANTFTPPAPPSADGILLYAKYLISDFQHPTSAR